VPSKNKRDTVRTDVVMAEERSNGFLQFGICDQISKPSNIFNNPLVSVCDATASVVPASFQIYMRRALPVPSVNILMFPHPDYNNNNLPPLAPPPSTPPPPYSPPALSPNGLPSSPLHINQGELGGPLMFESVPNTSGTSMPHAVTTHHVVNAEEALAVTQPAASTLTAESESVNPGARCWYFLRTRNATETPQKGTPAAWMYICRVWLCWVYNEVVLGTFASTASTSGNI